ncbi:hypothetical protein HXX76_003546 [Chlamydomonas incerta]|uniref:Uncharacterized protein n=1 Tax=Chlamydomonas incerta TaxID=51695 RepID=A0A835W9Q6_CHLIN|nr:hypothetical protein HXX76_003546 [Chlamydomonas incerta]|eukprot:KAG2441941.1 hypothetical protein HXX76_003546 [Chlamydomonas incerta]
MQVPQLGDLDASAGGQGDTAGFPLIPPILAAAGHQNVKAAAPPKRSQPPPEAQGRRAAVCEVPQLGDLDASAGGQGDTAGFPLIPPILAAAGHQNVKAAAPPKRSQPPPEAQGRRAAVCEVPQLGDLDASAGGQGDTAGFPLIPPILAAAGHQNVKAAAPPKRSQPPPEAQGRRAAVCEVPQLGDLDASAGGQGDTAGFPLIPPILAAAGHQNGKAAAPPKRSQPPPEEQGRRAAVCEVPQLGDLDSRTP